MLRCNRVNCPHQQDPGELDTGLNEYAEAQAVAAFEQLYLQYKWLGYERLALIQQQQEIVPRKIQPD